MKEILIALGGIFGAFLFGVLVLVATAIVLIKIYWPKVTRFLNEQAKDFMQTAEEAPTFARDSILSLLETWQADNLRQRATPQLLEMVPGGDLEILLSTWQESLGFLISCTELVEKESFSMGQVPGAEHKNLWDFTGIATATYQAQIQWERGEGLVDIQVIKRGDYWFVSMLNLQTDQTTLNLGSSTTLDALRERIMQEQKLEETIEVKAIEP